LVTLRASIPVILLATHLDIVKVAMQDFLDSPPLAEEEEDVGIKDYSCNCQVPIRI
jgi:hypothetical protein